MTMLSEQPDRNSIAEDQRSGILRQQQDIRNHAVADRPTLATLEEFYEFADFRLYPSQRKFTRGADSVAIGSRAFDLLHYLVSHAGNVISPRELTKHVWPNVTVDDANLRVQMAFARKALSQCDQAQRAVETVALRGYCFVLPVRHHSPDAIREDSSRPTLPNLPSLLNPVVGRNDAIKMLGAKLDESRLVTITGPGGIGKTTVAVAFLAEYLKRFQGAVSFIDLSHVSDEAGAIRAIAEALGVPKQSDAREGIWRFINRRHLLLVLDTCEHIVDHIAVLAEYLTSSCHNLRLLATSREALRARGERVLRLPSLTFPEENEKIDDAVISEFSAIALFVERVRSSSRIEIQRRDWRTIAEICRRLDGVPLALELAAARVADLGLRKVAAHLDDRFAILTRGRRTALPRHRTLSAALDWSYSLLSENEQRLLWRLAAYSGAFSAESVFDCGKTTPEAFGSLCEKSLLTVEITEGLPTYRLLDSMKAYIVDIVGGAARGQLLR